MRLSRTEAFAQKITNEFQFQLLLRQYDMLPDYGEHTLGLKNYKKTWWAYREQIRLNIGVYSLSEVLTAVNEDTSLHTHISVADKSRVAYTPDKSFGERDAQLVLGLGKLLTRLYPMLKDEEVQELVHKHTAELSDEIEFIDGIDNIAKAYKNMGTVGACMSKADEAYGGHNPILAYDAPGVRLAVLRNAKGEVSARSMVYEVSEDDKRYIRIYGDKTLLRRRLEKQGYCRGNWHGLRFKVIKTEDADGLTMYNMPYLDGNDTVGSESSSMVALIDDELVSVKAAYAEKLRWLKPSCVICAVQTTGRIRLESIDSSLFSMPDYVTGLTISRLEPYRHILVGGVEYGTIANDTPGLVIANTVVQSRRVQRLMPESECYSQQVYGDVVWFDKQQIAEYDYALLDEILYGAGVLDRAHNTCVTLSGKTIRRDDSLAVVCDTSGTSTLHISEIVKTGKNKHIKLGKAVYAMPGTKLYVTPSGRVVHPGVHSVVKQYDGVYEFVRNLKVVYILGRETYVPKLMTVNYDKGSKLYEQRVEELVSSGFRYYEECVSLSRVAKILYCLAAGAGARQANFSGYSTVDGYTTRVHLLDSVPVADQVEAVNKIADYMGSDAALVTAKIINLIYAEMTAVEPEQAAAEKVAKAAAEAAATSAELSAASNEAHTESVFSGLPGLEQAAEHHQVQDLTAPSASLPASITQIARRTWTEVDIHNMANEIGVAAVLPPFTRNL